MYYIMIIGSNLHLKIVTFFNQLLKNILRERIDLDKIKALFKKLISMKDSPNRLAKSVSLGFALALLPLPGINIPLSAVLAKILKLNIFAATAPALLLTYVSPLLYVLNYKTGALFINSSEKPPQDFAYDLTFWDKVVDFFNHAGPAYLLGSAINATLVSVASYLLLLMIFRNATRLFKGKKIKLTRIKKFKNGFSICLCHIKNPKKLSKIKAKKNSKKYPLFTTKENPGH
ncbi:MAG: DUF2062 domain-containing protein [Firmicutes bacterium]|nr:DUF2062 domain-containing protein [Bacillota bacterium]